MCSSSYVTQPRQRSASQHPQSSVPTLFSLSRGSVSMVWSRDAALRPRFKPYTRTCFYRFLIQPFSARECMHCDKIRKQFFSLIIFFCWFLWFSNKLASSNFQFGISILIQWIVLFGGFLILNSSLREKPLKFFVIKTNTYEYRCLEAHYPPDVLAYSKHSVLEKK